MPSSNLRNIANQVFPSLHELNETLLGHGENDQLQLLKKCAMLSQHSDW